MSQWLVNASSRSVSLRSLSPDMLCLMDVLILSLLLMNLLLTHVSLRGVSPDMVDVLILALLLMNMLLPKRDVLDVQPDVQSVSPRSLLLRDCAVCLIACLIVHEWHSITIYITHLSTLLDSSLLLTSQATNRVRRPCQFISFRFLRALLPFEFRKTGGPFG